MPDLTVANHLKASDEQKDKLFERYKKLVKPYDIHRNTPIAFPIAPPAGVFPPNDKIFHLARHNAKDMLACVSNQCERCAIEEQGGYLIIQTAFGFRIGDSMKILIRCGPPQLLLVLAIGEIWGKKITYV
jgi:hypothetical protein